MISVCMATHNGEKYIKEQIDSILKQLCANDEIVISDDGSNDNTLEILKEINDSRIKVFHQHSPKGLLGHEYATLNFENALRHSHGDYIFFADQDDVWRDDKVKVSMNYLEDFDYIVSDAYVTDAKLNVISETRFIKEEKVHFNKYLAVVLSTPYQGSCAAFRRCVLEKAMPFPKGIQSHDRWIGNVAAFYFKYRIIPDKLIYYRRHEGVTSSALNGKSKKRSAGIVKTIIYKLRYVFGLISIINRKYEHRTKDKLSDRKSVV